jgi:hypothetical protein
MSRALSLRALAVAAALTAPACAGHADIYRGTIDVTSPGLVPISPGSRVAVVADADEPLFATGHAYWLFHAGAWYRADDYRLGPWVRIATPPARLRAIAHPLAYRHFERHDSSAAILVRPIP